jgi:molybdopterin-guanine dinucleotide biosynthesis protein A
MQFLEGGDVDAVATRVGSDHLEPFNSFFSVRCSSLIEKPLARGNRGVGSFLRKCDRALFVQEEDARRFSPDWSMFLNINTRADVARYLSVCSGPIPLPYATVGHGCFRNDSA